MEKRVIIHYVLYLNHVRRTGVLIMYILISFIILNLFFIIFLYFNEINCIFCEYFIYLLLQRRHYFRLSIGLLQMYSLVYIPIILLCYNNKLSCDNKCQIVKLKAKWPN